MCIMVNMRNFTTLGIGGEAVAKIIEVPTDVPSLCHDAFVLGRGSNILVADSGIRSLVAINRMDGIKINGEVVSVFSGTNLSVLARELAHLGLSGLEWAYKLPASVGGALKMNAGAFGGQMSDSVISVTVYRNGEFITLDATQCRFGYRSSAFTDTDFIIKCDLRLKKSTKKKCVLRLVQSSCARKKQPKGKSAGCIYKTLDKSAGWYIEQAGLKGKRSGDIIVSPIHAGFLINEGRGSAKQMLSLMDYVEKAVQDKFGVTLEREIKLVGEF